MKQVKLFFGLLIPILIFGCKEYQLGTPKASTVADYIYTMTNDGYASTEITMTNLSINALTYVWDFGDGRTSTEENPVVMYDTPGLYTVTLTCTPQNEVYYNQNEKTMVINVKDPAGGKVQVLYYTSRNATGGGAHMVILNDNTPQIQDFEPVEFSRPYGIAADTINKKVYVSDYSLGYIYRFDADGKNPVRILDVNIPGQEIVGSPEALMVIGDKLYWGSTGGVFRCNLDGSSPEIYINTGGSPPEYPIDMEYDPITGKIYMVNDKTDYTGGYWSMNFDGSLMTEHILDIDGTAIEVDPDAGKIYMAIYASTGTAVEENGIYMCNLDGTSLTKIGDYGLKATWGVAIDKVRGKLFWSFKNTNADPDGKIVRSNLDGTSPEDWLTGISPHAMKVVWIEL
jgi:DNA-binding beta-propeller fold protein YncE